MIRALSYLLFFSGFAAWMVLQMREYGPFNVLWSCNAAFLVGVVGYAIRNRLMFDCAMVLLFIPCVAWSIDLAGGELFGFWLFGGTHYMLDHSISPVLRFLSLYHVFVPLVVLVYACQHRLRYDVLAYAVGLWIVVLCLSIVQSADNLNFVNGKNGALTGSALFAWRYFLGTGGIAVIALSIWLLRFGGNVALRWPWVRRLPRLWMTAERTQS